MTDNCGNNVINRLIKGNEYYITTGRFDGDVSEQARKRTVNGQSPIAVIIACSDSRVIPEAIFDAGTGEIFVIRVAGNVIDKTQLASVEYAVGHLKVNTVVVLGHTCCGAVGAAIHGEFGGLTGNITRRIKECIGDEHDDLAASKLNALAGAKAIKENIPSEGLTVAAAVYDISSGKVEFFDR